MKRLDTFISDRKASSLVWDGISMNPPTLGLVLDTTGELATGVEQIREAMRQQLVSTVHWMTRS